MKDLINRQDAIDAICDEIISRFDVGVTEGYELVEDALSGLPSADVPDTNVSDINCTDYIKHGGDWECDRMHCRKGTKQQATKASDHINRQDAIRSITGYIGTVDKSVAKRLLIEMPSVESVKAYTKADYIMALHKEYGCTLTMAEEAHNKALEHLRSKARMKG